MLKKLTATAVSGIFSGMMVGIGGAVFLSCDSKVVGAVLFAVALLSICMLSTYLFTGKIGYLATDRHLSTVYSLVVGLVGNAIGSGGVGLLISYCKPALREKALAACEPRLQQTPLQTLILAAFCGVLMYIAVEIYKTKGSSLGIIFCIPVFILSGFEHSVADIFYFTVSGIGVGSFIGFIGLAVVGNTVGSIATRVMQKIADTLK